MIKGRLSILIPALLLTSMAMATVVMIFTIQKQTRDDIANEATQQVNLDVTRLQNVLYNTLTGQNYDLEMARLNLSVTAMDANMTSIFLIAESGQIILSNRYSMEDTAATDYPYYDADIAHTVVRRNRPELMQAPNGKNILYGYYPVMLKLEGYKRRSHDDFGVLYVEYDYTNKVEQRLSEEFVHNFIYIFITFVVAIVIALILHMQVSRRLMYLNSAANAFAQGDLNQRSGIDGDDEIYELGLAFDKMAENLQRDIQRREEIEYEMMMLNENLEQAVASRTEELQEAQTIAHIGNWHWNESNNSLIWSDAIYRIFAMAPSEAIDFDSFVSMIHPDDVDELNMAIERAFEIGERYSIDHRIITRAGDLKWVHEEGIPKIDNKTGHRYMTGVIQDIDQRKQYEVVLKDAKEKAESANRAKSHFLSRMSHELRTPMNAILGFAQVLDSEDLAEEHGQYVKEILTAGSHLHELIKELLDISSIEAGKLTTFMETISLANVLDEAVKLTQSMAADKNITVNNSCLESINVIADKLRLREVFVNILGNAIKYNKAGGKVNISCDIQPNNKMHIVIQDTGEGLSDEQLARVYEPFERLGLEYSEVEGTGLGLHLSRQIMEVLDGRLDIISKSGEGTTVTIELNLGRSAILCDDENGEKSTDDRDGFIKVLYIEDNPANMRVVEAMLKNMQNLKIMTSGTGEHGLEQIRRYQPNIILLDINLPDMDGYDVLSRIKQLESSKNIPVIALTADAMPMEVERGLAAGFELYLTKPVRADALINAIHQYVA